MIFNREKLTNTTREIYDYDKDKIKGYFIFTDKAKERIQKLYKIQYSNYVRGNNRYI